MSVSSQFWASTRFACKRLLSTNLYKIVELGLMQVVNYILPFYRNKLMLILVLGEHCIVPLDINLSHGDLKTHSKDIPTSSIQWKSTYSIKLDKKHAIIYCRFLTRLAIFLDFVFALFAIAFLLPCLNCLNFLIRFASAIAKCCFTSRSVNWGSKQDLNLHTSHFLK